MFVQILNINLPKIYWSENVFFCNIVGEKREQTFCVEYTMPPNLTVFLDTVANGSECLIIITLSIDI
jgi:hypothetical protein